MKMSEKIYEVTIKGTTPLLQHRFSGAEEVGTTKKKTRSSQENNVEDTLYQLPDGTIYQPSDCIKQSMIEAAKAFKKGRSNMTKQFASFVIVLPEAIPHINKKWIADRRPVVIPSTRGRVMRNRAKFEEWSLKFDVQILDADEIPEQTLHDVLEYAGHYVGIGDYRPQKKGMYGRFIISEIKEKK